MSERRKYPYAEALDVAMAIHATLWSKCERCEIVGSLRRKKEHVSDIELLFVPRYELVADGFFDTVEHDLADQEILRWLDAGIISKRESKIGTYTWGKLNKLAVHRSSGIPLDLFTTSEQNWYTSLVIRTGSLETNLRLTNGAIARGGTLHAYGAGVEFSEGVVRAGSEADVFNLCGVPFLLPEQR